MSTSIAARWAEALGEADQIAQMLHQLAEFDKLPRTVVLDGVDSHERDSYEAMLQARNELSNNLDERIPRWVYLARQLVVDVFGSTHPNSQKCLKLEQTMERSRRFHKSTFRNVRALMLSVDMNSLEEDNLRARPAGDFWALAHSRVAEISRSRFESGQYADAVEAAMKDVNVRVKGIVAHRMERELDGVKLMQRAFSPNDPWIVIGDLSTQSGIDMQRGYMDLFSGSMSAIRNPKTHDNIAIDQETAIHMLFLASLLMFKLDERQ